ncbi:MAG: endonuclease III [Candidatus Wallbacteria bacterium]|nr:endonuclease III [Candidatus Wallbacteria bacterium]
MKAAFVQLPAKPKQRVRKIFNVLSGVYGKPSTMLRHDNAFELLAATILSAQCTDIRVNQVTPELFSLFPTPASMAKARQSDVERIIHSTGFFRAKARHLIAASRMITEEFKGIVPDTIDALTRLPGVGRKTANCVLVNAYGKPGITVDTHVGRLSRRLGFTTHTSPVKVEADLSLLWTMGIRSDFSMLLISHGRSVCRSRKPDCVNCVINHLCPTNDFSASAPEE